MFTALKHQHDRRRANNNTKLTSNLVTNFFYVKLNIQETANTQTATAEVVAKKKKKNKKKKKISTDDQGPSASSTG